MTAARVAVVLAFLAGLLVAHPRADAARRLVRIRPSSRAGPAGAAAAGAGGVVMPAWAARATLASAGLALLTGHDAAATVLLALAVAVGVPAARSRREAAAERAELARDLPRAADLLATCLQAGAAPADALAVVADAVGGPVAVRLRPVAVSLGSGSDVLASWTGAVDDPTARLVRALARATATGAPLAESLRDVALDERERARWLALERARRAGVQAVGPLAACFLPAFVLVGVVPVVAGVARTVLAGWG